VEVLTTCARDHVTWRNELPLGATVDAGVRVRRFAVTGDCDHGLMASINARLQYGFSLGTEAQEAWLRGSGYSEPLLAAIETSGPRVDAIIFAPYLFPSTVYGVRRHPRNSIVIPCLHDEPFIHFGLVQEALRSAHGLLFNSDAEADLAQRLLGDIPSHRVVGAGAGPPTGLRDVAGFRRRHRLDGDLVAWAGRREGGKNFPTLVHWTALHGLAFAPHHGVTLVAMGSGPISVPYVEAQILADVGVVSESEKYDAMAASIAVVNLSLNESFSLAIMEGWLCGVPCIVHAGCAVTREHCLRSGGGLWVESAEEYSETVRRLIDDAELRKTLGQAGRRYVDARYSWAAVLDRLEAALISMAP
jgi:glycosyltransferase involved in cell wall biosynthesis